MAYGRERSGDHSPAPRPVKMAPEEHEHSDAEGGMRDECLRRGVPYRRQGWKPARAETLAALFTRAWRRRRTPDHENEFKSDCFALRWAPTRHRYLRLGEFRWRRRLYKFVRGRRMTCGC